MDRDGSRGPPNQLCACKRALFRQDYYGPDSARHWLHDGWIHGEETSFARHDRELPSIEKSLGVAELECTSTFCEALTALFKLPTLPNRSAPNGLAIHATRRECVR